VYVAAAHNNTVVRVDWLASDDVISSAVLTLRQAQFVDFNSTRPAASCVYVNSSHAVLVAHLSRLASATGIFMSLVPALATSSSNYTFVAYRPQYDSDEQLHHYVQIVVEKSSLHNVVLDESRLNVTAAHWTDVCNTGGRFVSTVLSVKPGAHRLHTVDGRPLSGSVYGYSNTSAYECSLAAAVDDGTRLWTADYMWRETATSTEHATSAQTSPVTISNMYVTQALAAEDDDEMTSSLMLSDRVRSLTALARTTNDVNVTASDTGTTAAASSSSSSSLPVSLLKHTSRVATTHSVTSQSTRLSVRLSTTHATRQETANIDTTESATVVGLSSTDTLSTDVRQRPASNYLTSVTSTDHSVTEMTTNDYYSVGKNVTSTGSEKQSSLSSNSVTLPVSTQSTMLVSSSCSSSELKQQRDSTTAAATLAIYDADATGLHQTKDDNIDYNDAYVFELFVKVCIFGGLPVFCSLLAAWFLCSQTTLLKRAKCQRVIAAANDRASSLSRDQAPERFSSDDCSVTLSGSDSVTGTGSSFSQSLDNHLTTSIAPLTPAYFTSTPVALALDDSCLQLQSDPNVKPKTLVSRSVDVALLPQLTDCQHDTNVVNVGLHVHCEKQCRMNTAAAAACDRLYVDTPHQHSQQNLQHLISLPQSFSMTVDNRNVSPNTSSSC